MKKPTHTLLLALVLCLAAFSCDNPEPGLVKTGDPQEKMVGDDGADRILLNGQTDCAWGRPDCNRPAKNVRNQIHHLRKLGDIMGFFLNNSPDVTIMHHWQGIQRLSMIDPDSGDYKDFLALTRSTDDAGTPEFYVVNMGSRRGEGIEGERYRSNRLCPGVGSFHCPPDECFLDDDHGRDKVAHWRNVKWDFKHAGGFQVVGKWAAIPFQTNLADGVRPQVVIMDISRGLTDPDSLVEKHVIEVDDPNLGTVGFARLMNDRYLVVAGTNNCDHLLFYISNGFDLDHKDLEFNQIHLIKFKDLDGHRAYQNTSLIVEEGTGDLYLVCTYDSVAGIGGGTDWVHLWRLKIWEELGENGKVLSYSFDLQKSDEQTAVESQWGDHSRQCNLNAAAGAYVDPHGNLILYATEHLSSGPDGCVKMMEFRSGKPEYNPPVDKDHRKSWVEIYDDKDFKDRSIMIDFRDRNRRDYNNFDDVEYGFGDKASSVRWSIKPGWEGIMYEDHSYGGDECKLEGAGEYKDMGDEQYGCLGNDKASSFQFRD